MQPRDTGAAKDTAQHTGAHGEAVPQQDEVVAAIHSMAAADPVVSERLTRAEESLYYQVLDALQAIAEEEDNREQL